MIDQYCAGNIAATQEALSIFFEMLEGDSESKVHAFNLLFNLAVHVNLMMEHLPRLEGEALPGAAPSPPVSQLMQSRSAAVAQLLGSRVEMAKLHVALYRWFISEPDAKHLQMVSDDLYTKLCEMLLWMVHRRVHDQAAWQTAFQSFVTFVASVGHVDKARYAQWSDTSAV